MPEPRRCGLCFNNRNPKKYHAMKKTLTALLCSLFLLAPCSVAQTFTFETGRNGTGIVFGTDGYSSEVGVTTPYFLSLIHI